MVPVRDVVLQGDFRSRRRGRIASAVAQPTLRPWWIGPTDTESRVLAIGDLPKAERLMNILAADHPADRLRLG